MNKTTVIYHSADYDGIFCRETARKFLPGAQLIGWDFGDEPLDPGMFTLGKDDRIYVLDLPCDAPYGLRFPAGAGPESVPGLDRYVWIDHHASAIASHPKDIPGYRLEGVAACRLAWQWFTSDDPGGCPKEAFINRTVSEPLAVRLAGEYDIWDKRDPRAELFQHGLRSQPLGAGEWKALLDPSQSESIVNRLLNQGACLYYAKTQENQDIITHYGFTVQWGGLSFLACNHARYNSHLFTAGLKPEHDACLGFKWNGKGQWEVSLYHAPGKEHHDLSVMAVKHGGGGHRGACGFVCKRLPFAPGQECE